MKKILYYILAFILFAVFAAQGCTAGKEADDGTYETVAYDQLTDEMKSVFEGIRSVRGYSMIGDNEGKLFYFIGSGEKPTGGYTVSVEDVSLDDGTASVYISEVSPREGDEVTQAISYPYVIIKIDRDAVDTIEIFDAEDEQLQEISGNNDADENKYGIIGTVTAVERADGSVRITVFGEITDGSEYDKASVKLDADTHITVDGKEAGLDALEEGMTVKVRFEGPVAESYPVQAYASEVTAYAAGGEGDDHEDMEYTVIGTDEMSEDMVTSLGFIQQLRGFGIMSEDDDYYYLYIGSGEKNTSGYGIEVKNAGRDGNTVRITVEETVPGEGDMVAQVLTYPYLVIRVSKAGVARVEAVNTCGYVFIDINDETNEGS